MDKEYKDIHIINCNNVLGKNDEVYCERMCSCIEVRDNVITFHRRNDPFINKIILLDTYGIKVVID